MESMEFIRRPRGGAQKLCVGFSCHFECPPKASPADPFLSFLEFEPGPLPRSARHDPLSGPFPQRPPGPLPRRVQSSD